MPRKRKAKKNKKRSGDEQRPYLVGGFLLILAVLSLISLYSDQMGLFGEWTSSIIYFLFGSVAPLFCALLFIIGLCFITDRTLNLKLKFLILSVILFLSSMLFVYDSNREPLVWSERVENFHHLPVDGGLIGDQFARLLVGFLGMVGSRILLTFMVLFILYRMLTEKQKEKIGESLKNKFNSSRSAFKEAKKKRSENHREKVPKSRKSEKKEPVVSGMDAFKDEPKPKESEIEIRNYISEKTDKPKRAEPLNDAEKESFSKTIQTDSAGIVYDYPPISLLHPAEEKRSGDHKDIRKNADIIEEVMDNFNVDCHVTAINRGPSITSYELEPAPGVKISRIVSLHDNLSLSLASSDIRIEAPIPGKSAIGIEVPNTEKDSVGLREIIESKAFKQLDSAVPLSLGKDVSGETIISSIDKMPHLLIAGATGSGKSVCINSILMGILYKAPPEEVRLILIDPKVVELGIYNGIPHLLIPVVTDAKKAAFALAWAVEEMEKRYKAFAETGVRDISGYNEKIKAEDGEKMPKIVIVVDELSDLMMVAAKEVEDYITRLAQMARAAGIHLILATQRPSVDVITGTIKANIPSRIAFSVSSSIDSRTILDMSGAERLLGKGDMLFYPSSYSKPKRVQGAFVSDKEVEQVLNFIKSNTAEAEYDEEAMDTLEKKVTKAVSDEDPLLYDAIDIVLNQEQASISFLQRKLKVGYARAARIVDQIEEMGIIGPHEGSKPRKLLMTKEQIEAMKDQENI